VPPSSPSIVDQDDVSTPIASANRPSNTHGAAPAGGTVTTWIRSAGMWASLGKLEMCERPLLDVVGSQRHLVRMRARVEIALPSKVVAVLPQQVLNEGGAGLDRAHVQMDLTHTGSLAEKASAGTGIGRA
jgi:hypothetical protein